MDTLLLASHVILRFQPVFARKHEDYPEKVDASMLIPAKRADSKERSAAAKAGLQNSHESRPSAELRLRSQAGQPPTDEAAHGDQPFKLSTLVSKLLVCLFVCLFVCCFSPLRLWIVRQSPLLQD